MAILLVASLPGSRKFETEPREPEDVAASNEIEEVVHAEPAGTGAPAALLSSPETTKKMPALDELRTPTRLYASAKVGAVYERDALLGVRIEKIEEGSLWKLMGVENGDLVLEVNGELVDDPAASVYLMNALSDDNVLVLRVRGVDGNERILEFRVPRS